MRHHLRLLVLAAGAGVLLSSTGCRRPTAVSQETPGRAAREGEEKPEAGPPFRLPDGGGAAECPPGWAPLARPLPARPSCDDAAVAASIGAALAETLPPRADRVRYDRLRVPEPFPLRQPLRHPVPAEKATPPVP